MLKKSHFGSVDAHIVMVIVKVLGVDGLLETNKDTYYIKIIGVVDTNGSLSL